MVVVEVYRALIAARKHKKNNRGRGRVKELKEGLFDSMISCSFYGRLCKKVAWKCVTRRIGVEKNIATTAGLQGSKVQMCR